VLWSGRLANSRSDVVMRDESRGCCAVAEKTCGVVVDDDDVMQGQFHDGSTSSPAAELMYK